MTSQQAVRTRWKGETERGRKLKAAVADSFKVCLSPGLFFLFLIGNNIQLQGIGIDHLEFRAAFGAVQRLAFFDLISNVDYGLAFWTESHTAPLDNNLTSGKSRV